MTTDEERGPETKRHPCPTHGLETAPYCENCGPDAEVHARPLPGTADRSFCGGKRGFVAGQTVQGLFLIEVDCRACCDLLDNPKAWAEHAKARLG